MRDPGSATELRALQNLPALRPSLSALRERFGARGTVGSPVLWNPHREPQVGPGARLRGRAASVLLLLCGEPQPTLLLTRRSARVRYAGHEVFPGGLQDAEDHGPEAAMYREVEEEIGLARGAFELLGRLGDYCTHTGYRIAPFVGVCASAPELRLSADEVDRVTEIPLSFALDPSNYRMRVRSTSPFRANYYLSYDGITITGPTVSLLMHLYFALTPTR